MQYIKPKSNLRLCKSLSTFLQDIMLNVDFEFSVIFIMFVFTDEDDYVFFVFLVHFMSFKFV